MRDRHRDLDVRCGSGRSLKRVRANLDEGDYCVACNDAVMRTEVVVCSRVAAALALQSVIVRGGRRPWEWREPAGLVGEAEAAGWLVPTVDGAPPVFLDTD